MTTKEALLLIADMIEDGRESQLSPEKIRAVVANPAASTDAPCAVSSPSPLVADGLTEAAVDWLRIQLDNCIAYAETIHALDGAMRALVDDLRDARRVLG